MQAYIIVWIKWSKIYVESHRFFPFLRKQCNVFGSKTSHSGGGVNNTGRTRSESIGRSSERQAHCGPLFLQQIMKKFESSNGTNGKKSKWLFLTIFPIIWQLLRRMQTPYYLGMSLIFRAELRQVIDLERNWVNFTWSYFLTFGPTIVSV